MNASKMAAKSPAGLDLGEKKLVVGASKSKHPPGKVSICIPKFKFPALSSAKPKRTGSHCQIRFRLIIALIAKMERRAGNPLSKLQIGNDCFFACASLNDRYFVTSGFWILKRNYFRFNHDKTFCHHFPTQPKQMLKIHFRIFITFKNYIEIIRYLFEGP